MMAATNIALLTAAAMHGAAHQAPQTFQVITDKHVPDRELGRNRLPSTPAAPSRTRQPNDALARPGTCSSPTARRQPRTPSSIRARAAA